MKSDFIRGIYLYEVPLVPEIVPVSIVDVERLPPIDMMLPMSDGCPRCGGHNMRVGDYVCWGTCYGCYVELSGGHP